MSDLPYDFYTQEVYDHFQNPHHAGVMTDATDIGEVGNIVCGDLMRIYLKIEINPPQEPYIKDISFETYGCAAAIATSSLTTDLALGKTLTEALTITKDQVVTGLTRLPPQKVHCSILAVDALGEAIYNYFVRTNSPISPELEKRHQHIAQQQTILAERYAEWSKNSSDTTAAASETGCETSISSPKITSDHASTTITATDSHTATSSTTPATTRTS